MADKNDAYYMEKALVEIEIIIKNSFGSEFSRN